MTPLLHGIHQHEVVSVAHVEAFHVGRVVTHENFVVNPLDFNAAPADSSHVIPGVAERSRLPLWVVNDISADVDGLPGVPRVAEEDVDADLGAFRSQGGRRQENQENRDNENALSYSSPVSFRFEIRTKRNLTTFGKFAEGKVRSCVQRH